MSTKKTPVIIYNSDLELISRLRASGMTWRDVQRQNARWLEIPLQSLWAMWKRGEVLDKYRYKDARKRRPTLVARVDPALKDRVRRVCEAVGATEAEYLRQLVETDIMRQEEYLR